jgi:hypothetical protein
MPELPATYDELRRWFPQQTDRAAALGVSREMVWRWERVRAAAARPQVRTRTARVVEDVVATARATERRVGDPEAAGRWMLVAQPSLRGRTVATAVAEGRVAEIARLLAPPPLVQGRFAASELRAGTAVLGVEPVIERERPRDPVEATILERFGEDPRLIGPRDVD